MSKLTTQKALNLLMLIPSLITAGAAIVHTVKAAVKGGTGD